VTVSVSARSSTRAETATTAARGGAVLPEGNTHAYCSVDRDGTITQGGYATHVVVDEDFALRIPDTLDFSKVARSCAPASRHTRRCDTGWSRHCQWPCSPFGNRRSFAGSSTAGLAETQEMLDFCAEHGIEPEIELIDATAINDAWDRVPRTDVRYRFVMTPPVSAHQRARRADAQIPRRRSATSTCTTG
jgi:hypothetical protein